MYQYRQIIFRLRQGDSIRGIAQAKLADRKKLRQVRDIAIQQGWLNIERDLPTDEEKRAKISNQFYEKLRYKISVGSC